MENKQRATNIMLYVILSLSTMFFPVLPLHSIIDSAYSINDKKIHAVYSDLSGKHLPENRSSNLQQFMRQYNCFIRFSSNPPEVQSLRNYLTGLSIRTNNCYLQITSASFWLSWPAFLLYLLLFLISCGILLLLNTINRYQKQELHYKQAALEKEQAVKQYLYEMDKRKDEFLLRISRELRAPINHISGIAESAYHSLTLQGMYDLAHNIDYIVRSGKRLSLLIDDILDFCMLRTSSVNLVKEAVDMRVLADIVLNLCCSFRKKPELMLSNMIPPGPPYAWGDKKRIEQILYNLIGNAVKYTEKGMVRIQAGLMDNQLEITVIDTGEGIGKEKLNTLFDAYTERTNNYECRGTGLSLGITRELVILHGGNFSITSEKGTGTTVSFTLPIAETAIAGALQDTGMILPFKANNNPADIKIPAGNYTILIADAEFMNHQVFSAYLEKEYYKIYNAYNSAQVFEIINTQKVDLIILDMMLPCMSGFEITKEIRKQFPLQELPVIILKTPDLIMDTDIQLAFGINDFLLKPVSLTEMLTRVRTHLKLVQFNHLERINREKIMFVNSLEQEIRTPLAIIKNCITQYSEQNKIILSHIYQNAEIISQFISHYIDLEKLINEEIVYKHDTIVNLTQFLREEITCYQELMLYKRLEIKINDQPDLYIKIDPLAMDRIVSSIIEIYMQYTTDTKQINITLNANENKVFLNIDDADSYFSVPEPHALNITGYDMLMGKQYPYSIKMRLTLIKKIITGINGAFFIEYNAAHGYKIRIILNKHFAAEGMVITHSPSQFKPVIPGITPLNKTGKMNEKFHCNELATIFCVDDNVMLLSYMQMNIRDKYNFYYAENGLIALKKLNYIPKPDIIISDIVMTPLDGYEFLDRLKLDKKLADIPFIFLTAHDPDTIKLNAFAKGAIDVISKPFKMDELLFKIDALITNRRRQQLISRTELKEKLMELINHDQAENPTHETVSRKFEEYEITEREKEIIELIVMGKTNQEIADILCISTGTVRRHLENIYKKCCINNRTELAVLFN